MLDTFLRLIKWVLIIAVAAVLFFVFIHVVFPLIAVLIIAGVIYYLYKRNRLARQKARYTPEGRKKVN
ncbi:hypothetical protein [Companilactobacillus zhongbaensis]|uniref:hypothetical protein n=1 Tax=Companilactobacillus zhongbaensis TaxID=2486009 RepID=UPI000F795E38|nr:hypothetical protein [Companilactobacillus zhongbaensis]